MICRVLIEPTVKCLKHAQKKNVFRNNSPEGDTDTSAMITGKFSILCVQYCRVFGDFLNVFSFYSETAEDSDMFTIIWLSSKIKSIFFFSF